MVGLAEFNVELHARTSDFGHHYATSTVYRGGGGGGGVASLGDSIFPQL